MARNTLISVLCTDRRGLIADIAGQLYDMNINLADTTFAVLGELAEFTCLAEIPSEESTATVEQVLRSVPDMENARITVALFDMNPVHDESAHITHRISFDGRDQPGLIARISEVFGQFDANIVRLNSERTPEAGFDRYVTRFSVNMAPERARACLATVANTAGELRLSVRVEQVTD